MANWWQALTLHVRSGRPANTKYGEDVGLILVHRLRRWANYKHTSRKLGELYGVSEGRGLSKMQGGFR